MKTQEELRERLATLNGSGGHACYCPRSVDGGCRCSLKDEYVDEIVSLIKAELSSQREDLEAKHKEEMIATHEDYRHIINSVIYALEIADMNNTAGAIKTTLDDRLGRQYKELTKSKKGEE